MLRLLGSSMYAEDYLYEMSGKGREYVQMIMNSKSTFQLLS
jgi:hypothetical protein